MSSVYKEITMASSTLWWCLAKREGQGILSMVLWRFGILLMDLTFMRDFWGPCMASDLLMLSVVIGQSLIWVFLNGFF